MANPTVVTIQEQQVPGNQIDELHIPISIGRNYGVTDAVKCYRSAS